MGVGGTGLGANFTFSLLPKALDPYLVIWPWSLCLCLPGLSYCPSKADPITLA